MEINGCLVKSRTFRLVQIDWMNFRSQSCSDVLGHSH